MSALSFTAHVQIAGRHEDLSAANTSCCDEPQASGVESTYLPELFALGDALECVGVDALSGVPFVPQGGWQRTTTMLLWLLPFSRR